jgi:transposase-like protein
MISKPKRPNFKPEFRLEVAELVLNKDYSVREAAEAMDVGNSTVDKWVCQLKQKRDGVYPSAPPMTPDQIKIRELEKKIRNIEEEKEILKKGYDSLTIGLNEKFSLVSKLQENHCFKRNCQVFDIHPSSYKYWQGRSKKPSLEQAKLNSEVRAAFKVSNGTAGSRSIANMVTTNGIPLSRYRARGLMKKLGLRSNQPSSPKYKKAIMST